MFETSGQDDLPAWYGSYSFSVMIEAPGLGGAPFNMIRGGIDSVAGSLRGGRHVTGLYSQPNQLIFEDEG